MVTKTLNERVAALEERAKARDIEMRDFKTTVTAMDAKLDVLVARDNKQQGAMSLGKFIAGTGVFGGLSAVLLTFWERITN